MTKLTKIGFFEDLPYGDRGSGRLADARDKLSIENIEKIVDYLKAGADFIMAPTWSMDIFRNDRVASGTLIIKTDGIWVWPSDLAYYVENYRVELPEEFASHMKNQNWKIGEVDLENLSL